MNRIEFRGVSKSFPHAAGRMLLRTRMLEWFGAHKHERFFALRNVTFDLQDGESVALIGGNGAGKSTLLSLVAGLAAPDAGTVAVNGRIAALLELGSGFHPDLTGAENLVLNASLLGMSRRDTYAAMDSMVDFSGVGDFIHEPLRTYSSGMVVRLAFSVAIHINPDILIVDEVLAVGDHAFQQKSAAALRHLREQGKTLLFVSHSGAAVQAMCERALWLDHGQVVSDGNVKEVLEAYEGRSTVA